MKELVKKLVGNCAFGFGVIIATPIAFVYGVYCALKGKSEEEFQTDMHRFFHIE